MYWRPIQGVTRFSLLSMASWDRLVGWYTPQWLWIGLIGYRKWMDGLWKHVAVCGCFEVAFFYRLLNLLYFVMMLILETVLLPKTCPCGICSCRQIEPVITSFRLRGCKEYATSGEEWGQLECEKLIWFIFSFLLLIADAFMYQTERYELTTSVTILSGGVVVTVKLKHFSLGLCWLIVYALVSV